VDYTTDTQIQTISGTTTTDTKQILVNGSVFGVSYTAGSTVWAYTNTLSYGINTIQIVAIDIAGDTSPSSTINVTVTQQQVTVTVAAPTGIQLKRYQNQVEVICAENTEANIVGYNFYVSYISGGNNGSYVKINSQLVNIPSFYETKTTQLSNVVDTVGDIRVTTTTEKIENVNYYSVFLDQTTYNNMVNAGSLPNTGFNQSVPFFFVITAVIYDPSIGQSTESNFSLELQGSPITITSGIVDLPPRTQSDIILTYAQELLASNAGINFSPGTVLRDMMDPISEEQARTYIIQDFLSNSLSVSTLQDFDDANGDGISDPVSSSPAKTALQIALQLTDPDQVQKLIDSQFDKLGANVNMTREGPETAVGNVLFYTPNPPIRNMTVNQGALINTLGDSDNGIPSQTYRCTTTQTMSYNDRASYYNSTTQRYEMSVPVEALVAGAAGNTASNSIVGISSGVDSDFLVTNPNAIMFGQDNESNYDFAGRMMLAYFVDTGTSGGYAKTAINILGVEDVKVVAAGDDLMWRDYDTIRNKHIGGKVDVWVQGSTINQVSDQIAFSFENGTGGLSGEKFDVISAVAFQFKCENPAVSVNTPIFEVSQIYNATRSAAYDLSNYEIIGDGNIISLDPTRLTNIGIGLASEDVIKVDYKYRGSNIFVLQNQPVENIISVVGQISGPLTTANYQLVKTEDPLQNGLSTIAKDGLQIIFANGLPLTEFQNVQNEQHVMVQGISENLTFLGVDPESISITNSNQTITYTRNVDYTINTGSVNTPTSILILDSGRIANGELVFISYTAIENFVVTYSINTLLETVQTQINSMKHACADAIVKEAVQNSVNFTLTVVPKSAVVNLAGGYDQLTSQIQTAVSNLIGNLPIGSTLTQATVVAAIQSVPDVDYVILPMILMAKADGSFIVNNNIGTETFEVFGQGITTSYITVSPVLTYKTVDQGGPSNVFKGVFENNLTLTMQTDPLAVCNASGRAYIRSDGRLIISTLSGNLPDTNKYSATYWCYGETGSQDIQTSSLEYLKIGTFSITYDTASIKQTISF
jgi:hypothetical protein